MTWRPPPGHPSEHNPKTTPNLVVISTRDDDHKLWQRLSFVSTALQADSLVPEWLPGFLQKSRVRGAEIENAMREECRGQG